MVLRITICYFIALLLAPCVAQDDLRKINMRGQELLDKGQSRQSSEVFRQASEIGAPIAPLKLHSIR